MVDFPRFQHPAIAQFAEVAAHFCSLVEHVGDHDRQRFLGRLHILLPRLYSAGLALPSTDVLFTPEVETGDNAEAEPEPPRSPDPDRQSHEAWRALATALGELFGEQGGYREVFDPYAPDTDPEVYGSLADDVADIYGDIRCGLLKWQRGDSGDALWAWRFGLENHWGEHLTGALRAIFALAAWHDIGWPDPDPDDAA